MAPEPRTEPFFPGKSGKAALGAAHYRGRTWNFSLRARRGRFCGELRWYREALRSRPYAQTAGRAGLFSFSPKKTGKTPPSPGKKSKET